MANRNNNSQPGPEQFRLIFYAALAIAGVSLVCLIGVGWFVPDERWGRFQPLEEALRTILMAAVVAILRLLGSKRLR